MKTCQVLGGECTLDCTNYCKRQENEDMADPIICPHCNKPGHPLRGLPGEFICRSCGHEWESAEYIARQEAAHEREYKRRIEEREAAIRAAFDSFYWNLSKKGDPLRRPNLTFEAFLAGVEFGREGEMSRDMDAGALNEAIASGIMGMTVRRCGFPGPKEDWVPTDNPGHTPCAWVVPGMWHPVPYFSTSLDACFQALRHQGHRAIITVNPQGCEVILYELNREELARAHGIVGAEAETICRAMLACAETGEGGG